MATAASHRSRPRTAGALAVVALLLVLTLPLLAGPASAGGTAAAAPADVVSAVTAAYGTTGTVAVAVAPQETRATGLSPRAAEARSAELAAAAAGNDLAGRPLPTASLVKLFIAEDLLHMARQGAVTLTPDDRDRMAEMVRRSSDPIASDLWVRFDGDRLVRDVAARYGLRATAPPPVRGQWGETTTTARDLASFLARLPVVAHPDDAAALTAWMREPAPAAADGFDQRFGVLGAVPAGAAVKQGWMCCLGGMRHLHSVGVVGTHVVVLLSEVPAAVGWDAARASLTAAAAAAPSGR
ncbi:LppW family protein [Geodermatophilus sp. SYSU D01186]